MSPLRKVIKQQNATKSPKHQVAQSIKYQQYTLSETLSLCVLVAKKDFSEWTHICRKNNEMNIQARKLVLIEEFLRISDESFITKLESFIRQEKKVSHEKNLKPMSLNEFHEMINQAKKDSEAGRVISHPELKKKMKTWE